jgi:hypothetical protein
LRQIKDSVANLANRFRWTQFILLVSCTTQEGPLEGALRHQRHKAGNDRCYDKLTQRLQSLGYSLREMSP